MTGSNRPSAQRGSTHLVQLDVGIKVASLWSREWEIRRSVRRKKSFAGNAQLVQALAAAATLIGQMRAPTHCYTNAVCSHLHQLQHRGKGVVVDLENVQQAHNAAPGRRAEQNVRKPVSAWAWDLWREGKHSAVRPARWQAKHRQIRVRLTAGGSALGGCCTRAPRAARSWPSSPRSTADKRSVTSRDQYAVSRH